MFAASLKTMPVDKRMIIISQAQWRRKDLDTLFGLEQIFCYRFKIDEQSNSKKVHI
jgi:hypothetical protein